MTTLRNNFLLFSLFLFIGGIVGLGNNAIYIIFLFYSLYYLIKSKQLFNIPLKAFPIISLVLTLILFSSFYFSIASVQITYSLLYLASLLTLLFAYRFNELAINLILTCSYAISIYIFIAWVFYPSHMDLLISQNFDTNFLSYFILSGIFSLSITNTINEKFKNYSYCLFLFSGILLESRSFIFLSAILFGLLFWRKNIFYKIFVLSGIIIFISIIMGFFNQNSAIMSALITAFEGAPNLDNLYQDRRRVGLISTGILYISENFPNGTGLGPENYNLGIIQAGLQPPSYIRIGYPHNYYISIIAQAGLAGLIFIIYLLFLGIKSLKSYPIIMLILVAVALNEYIGIPALWSYIGIYLRNGELK